MAAVAVSEMAHTVVDGLTPAERRHLGMLEKRIAHGISTFREVGESLMEIRDERLYRETHGTFEAYCRDKWMLDRGRAYQLIGAAEVARALPSGFPALANEAQARELVPLVHENPSAVAEVWREVTASDEPLSASRIRQAVRQHIPKADAPPVSQTTALVAAYDRLIALAEKWVASKPSRRDRDRVREAHARLNKALT